MFKTSRNTVISLVGTYLAGTAATVFMALLNPEFTLMFSLLSRISSALQWPVLLLLLAYAVEPTEPSMPANLKVQDLRLVARCLVGAAVAVGLYQACALAVHLVA